MKKGILSILFILVCFGAFAEKWNVYAGADKKTLETIKKCDEFIENKQYQSAVNVVGGCENEYIIYKYIEVCTQYFAQSIMHTMFAFKNLEGDETLYDVRTGEGSFNLIYREEPDKIIDNYKNIHGNSIVLELARANYYYDALCRYGNQWLKTQEEILTLAKDVYSRAIAKNVYDERVVGNYAYIKLQENNYPEAEKLYTMLSDKFPTNGNYWYHLTVTKMMQEKYKDAINSAKMAVENPEDNPNYHLDAYLILADAYSYSGDYDTAEKTLLAAHEKYDYQSIVFQRLGELYLSFKDNIDYKKADSYLDKTLDVVCDDNTIYNCINEYMTNATPEMAIDFCRRNMKTHKEKNNQGYFNFFLSQVYISIGDTANAKKTINEAEKIFKKLKDNEWLDYCASVKEDLK